jgi:Sulfotransferase domain
MLNVIGVGFPRTGTTSQQAALEALGFPCYKHGYRMSTVITQAEVCLWEAAADGQPVDWEELFSGYQATVDLPGLAFWRELVDAYPDAKVLLSVRDPDQWYDSVERTILRAASQRSAPGFESTAFSKRFSPEFKRMTDKVIKRFGGLFGDREQAIEAFERHNQEVQRYVPAERLLVYEVTQGWEPLCAFLGVPIPVDVPFPHLNDTETARARLRSQMNKGATHPRQATVTAE